MKGKIFTVTILLLLTYLFFPALTLSKRPQTEYEPFLDEKIQKARDLEKRGDHRGAEEEFLNIYKEAQKKFKWRKSKNSWDDYMMSLRAVIAFYYGRGNFPEVDWYFREYHHELEEDKEAGGMLLMLLQDVDEVVEDLVSKKKPREAELVYLDLEENLGKTLGYQHFLVGELYRRMAAFYINIGNAEEGRKYAEKASTLMKE